MTGTLIALLIITALSALAIWLVRRDSHTAHDDDLGMEEW